MSAAPFENNDNDNNNIHDNNNAYRKRQHNRTQKNIMKNILNPEKINSVLQSIHESMNTPGETTDIDGNSLGDYYANPPPNPTSIGSQRASIKEGMQSIQSTENDSKNNTTPTPLQTSDDLDLNNFNSNYYDEAAVQDYYKKFAPNYNPSMMMKTNTGKNIPYYSQTVSSPGAGTGFNKNEYKAPSPSPSPSYATNTNTNTKSVTSNTTSYSSDNYDILIQKLNYMIHLLEEKQDERTNNVTEEVVLYSFLGIFIIFIVDSFSRVGKYTR